MIPAIAIFVALACAAASARRLWLLTSATWLHPDEVLHALDIGATVDELRQLVAREERADWERDLLEALATASAPARQALVNEQLMELDHRQQRWARVPTVCASVASAAGFLLATLVLREGLLEGSGARVTLDVGQLVTHGFVGDALTVAALGVVARFFCGTVQSEAKRLAAARTKAADRLVERLEALGGDAA